MREFENRIPEDIFSFVETELGEYEDAMSDQRLRRSLASARSLEQRINMGEELDITEEIQRLDLEINHLISQQCDLTGTVGIFTPEGEYVGQQDVEALTIAFHGYCIAPPKDGEDDDDVRIAYTMTANIVDDEFVTRAMQDRLIKENPDQTVVRDAIPFMTIAYPEDVSIDFQIATPDRALAWLNVMYPDTVREIDELLLAKEVGGSYEEIRDDEALCRLGQFQLERPEGLSDKGWTQYGAAVANYALSLCTIDPVVPYAAYVHGPVAAEDAYGNKEPVQYIVAPSMLLKVGLLGVSSKSRFEIDDEHEDEHDKEVLVFSLHGTEIPDDVYGEYRTIIVPLSSVMSLASLRGVVL